MIPAHNKTIVGGVIGTVSSNTHSAVLDAGMEERDSNCHSPDGGSITDDGEMETELADQYGSMTSQELEKAKEECKTNKHVKPPYSYIALITMAVLQVC